MKYLRFAIILIITMILMWYICDALLWLEFKMKPYTEFGKALFTWGQHTIFILLSLYFTVTINVAIEKDRAKKKLKIN